MNREEHLMKTFPLEDGTTYIGNLDNVMCEYSGLPSVQSYEPMGLGVGGESLKEKFIDSSEQTSGSVNGDIDFMYNWIRKHSGK
jgi:hypothetical protein